MKHAREPSDLFATQNPRYAAAHQVTANFPKTFAERAAERHSYGPGKLNVLYIFANDLAIFLV
jgi:hypothetical protein